MSCAGAGKGGQKLGKAKRGENRIIMTFSILSFFPTVCTFIMMETIYGSEHSVATHEIEMEPTKTKFTLILEKKVIADKGSLPPPKSGIL